jgi:uroporphyrinogen-III synthase
VTRALENRTVAITEHRLESEFRRLFEKQGARVISCPLLEEKPFENTPELEEFVARLIGDEFDFLQFFTGVGVRFLTKEAERQGLRDAFVAALNRTTIVARGPKPKAALREIGRKVDHAPEKPTSEGLLELFSRLEVGGKRIGVQLYGAPNEEYIAGLRAMGAHVTTVHVYDYIPASDTGRVRDFIRLLLDERDERIDVLTFTSAPQVSSLYRVAEDAGLAGRLTEKLKGGIAVAVIGEVAGSAVRRRGIEPRIRPANPKLAPFVDAIARYFAPSPE